VKARFIIIILFIAIASFITGGYLAIKSLRDVDQVDFMLYNGPWRVNPSMDLKDTKQRALIAKVGLFALRESEVIYYTAIMDSDGDPLDSNYDYILEGSVPNARYWSYTLYGKDNFMIPNPNKIYGYNDTSISYTPKDSINPELQNISQPTYTMHISKERTGENWIPSGENNTMALTLRLYNASPEVYNNLTTIPLPSIKRVK